MRKDIDKLQWFFIGNVVGLILLVCMAAHSSWQHKKDQQAPVKAPQQEQLKSIDDQKEK